MTSTIDHLPLARPKVRIWKESFLSAEISRFITIVLVTMLIKSQLICEVILSAMDANEIPPVGVRLFATLAQSREFDLQLLHSLVAWISNDVRCTHSVMGTRPSS